LVAFAKKKTCIYDKPERRSNTNLPQGTWFKALS